MFIMTPRVSSATRFVSHTLLTSPSVANTENEAEINTLSVIGADRIHTEDDPLQILLANGPSQSFRQTRVQSFNSHQRSQSAF